MKANKTKYIFFVVSFTLLILCQIFSIFYDLYNHTPLTIGSILNSVAMIFFNSAIVIYFAFKVKKMSNKEIEDEEDEYEEQ